MHIIFQNKISGCFPYYSEVTVACHPHSVIASILFGCPDRKGRKIESPCVYAQGIIRLRRDTLCSASCR